MRQIDRQGDDDLQRDIVLHRKDVVEFTVIAFRPNMVAALRIDQLSGDPDSIARLAHTAFQDKAHTELPANLSHIDGLALLDEGRIAGHDDKVGDP